MRFIAIFFGLFWVYAANAQEALILSPAKPGPQEKVHLTYNPVNGNGKLSGVKEIYLHAGLITNQSAHPKDWKYVKGTWGVADPALKLVAQADGTFTLDFIPADFFGVASSEQIFRMAFVFRNADGTLAGKTKDDQDFYIDLIPWPEQEQTIGNMKWLEVPDSIWFTADGRTALIRIEKNTIALTTDGSSAGFKVSFNDGYIASSFLKPSRTNNVVDSGKAVYWTSHSTQVRIQKRPLMLQIYSHGSWVNEMRFYSRGSWTGWAVRLKADEQITGTGSRALPLNLNGQAFDVYNTAVYGYSWGAKTLNLNIPYMLSNAGYSMYTESYAPGHFDFGVDYPGWSMYRLEDTKFTLHFLLGNYDQMLFDYTQMTGRQPQVPDFAWGFIQSKYGYKSAQETEQVADSLIKHGFPVSAMVLDLYWFGGMNQMGRYAWDSLNWKDYRGMLTRLKKKKVGVIPITEPFFTIQSGAYNELAKLGYLATDSLHQPYLLKGFWAGDAGLIDITNPNASAWLWERYKTLIPDGVVGWWCDLGEPETHPKNMMHVGGTARQIHNAYGLLWAKMLYEGYQKDFPHRPFFNLARSGWAGIQRYGVFPWSGDVQRSFSGLKAQIPIMLNAGMAGVAYMSSDLGGFTGGPQNNELYIRWLQFGCFTGIMRAHGEGVPPEPIYYPDSVQTIVRTMVKIRKEFKPYNQRLAKRNAKTGRPLALPMNYFNPLDTALANCSDQYWWGPSFIVAPVVTEGQRQRDVVFPAGRWQNFWTGEERVFKETTRVMVNAPLNQIPLFRKMR